MTPQFQHIETRTWYKNGKYMGDAAPWRIVDRAVIEQELTGDFYGEWQGTRHFDGSTIVADHIERAVQDHASPIWHARAGEVTHCPIQRDSWGEWRIVTVA